MKRITVVGLCLAIASVLSAVAAVSVSAAAPEYGRCFKQAGGKYKNASCTLASVPGEEKYEWFPGPGPKAKFTSTLKPATVATLETTGGAKVTCTGETNSGEYTGPKTIANLAITFTGCEAGALKCSTEGAAAGEVITEPLAAGVAFAIFGKKEKREGTGIGRATAPAEGEVIVTMTCAGLSVTLKGTVLNFLMPNKMQLTSILKYKATKGKQKPQFYENEAKENEFGVLFSSFGGGPFVQTGLSAEVVQTNEEKIEINKVV